MLKPYRSPQTNTGANTQSNQGGLLEALLSYGGNAFGGVQAPATPAPVAQAQPVVSNTGGFTGSLNALTQGRQQAGAELAALNNQPTTALQQPTGFENFSNVAQGVGSLANAWLGFRNLGLAKDSFNFNKALAETNLANQASTVNRQLETGFNQAQQFYGADDPRYASLDTYLAKNAVSGKL